MEIKSKIWIIILIIILVLLPGVEAKGDEVIEIVFVVIRILLEIAVRVLEDPYIPWEAKVIILKSIFGCIGALLLFLILYLFLKWLKERAEEKWEEFKWWSRNLKMQNMKAQNKGNMDQKRNLNDLDRVKEIAGEKIDQIVKDSDAYKAQYIDLKKLE